MNQPRFLLAIVLCLGVFYVYYTWINPPPKPIPQTTPQEVQKEPIQKNENNLQTPLSSPTNWKLEEDQEQLEKNDQFVLENDKIVAIFNSYLGIATSWKLKEYPLTMQKESPLNDILEGGRGFVLTLGYPDFDDQAVFKGVKTLKGDSSLENELFFKWSSPELEVEKNYILGTPPSPYSMDIEVIVTNKSTQNIQLDPKILILRPQKEEKEKGGFFSFLNPVNLFSPTYYFNGKVKTHSNWKKLKPGSITGQIYWSGMADRYFLASFISRQGDDQNYVSYGKGLENVIFSSLSYGPLFLKPGETIKRNFLAYVGPKKREELKKIGSHLEASVNYGFFSILAIPILYLLIFFQKIVVNWGLAIIALTIFVKLLLHPINKKSMNSMKAMQKLQPRLKEIREKFQNDRQRLNMEMMNLFKAHKVNPMSGCLPMILQMPVYIALYKVLWSAVELYQTPFFWFYKDLSAPDPYLITPILLGVFMALQQKFMPQATTMEPAQQKMMMIMPLMFSVFMIFLPFGLVLYILVNTVMSVVQQYMVQHEMSFMELMKKGIGKIGLSS